MPKDIKRAGSLSDGEDEKDTTVVFRPLKKRRRKRMPKRTEAEKEAANEEYRNELLRMGAESKLSPEDERLLERYEAEPQVPGGTAFTWIVNLAVSDHVTRNLFFGWHTTEKEAKQALDRLPREVEDEPLIKYLKARPEVRLVEKSRLQLRNTSKQSVIHTLVSPNTHGYKHRNSISHTPMHAAGYRALMKTPRTVARSVTTPKSIE